MAASRHRTDGQDSAVCESVAAAIAKNFEDDSALYDDFAASCQLQFKIDAVTGRRACKAGDLNALRRLCHDLKSVLLVLGRPELSHLAVQTENAALEGKLVDARGGWRRLSGELLRTSLR